VRGSREEREEREGAGYGGRKGLNNVCTCEYMNKKIKIINKVIYFKKIYQ
jgi:hypothetical protein